MTISDQSLRRVVLAAVSVSFFAVAFSWDGRTAESAKPSKSITSRKSVKAAGGAKGQQAGEFKFYAYEGFSGKTLLSWAPVRHDPTHVSLKKNLGKLTITTQRGSIHTNEKGRGDPIAKNLFVLNNPLAKAADFTLTTCVTSFEPDTAYQQAGLICYDDDDNYLKWSYEFNWRKRRGQTFSFLHETNGLSEILHSPSPQKTGAIWLRLTKRGISYEYSASTDGKKFTVYGEEQWGDGVPRKFGVYAKNGGPAGVPEIDASFDFFEIRSPVSPREKD